MRVNVDLVKEKLMSYELQEALTLIADNVGNTEHEEQAVLLSQRFHRAKKEQDKGTMSDDEFDTEMNKITLSMTNLLRTLKSEFISQEMVFNPKIHFCASEFDKVPEYKDRVYGENFENDTTSAVCWELRSTFPSTKFPISVGVKWRFSRPDSGFSAEYSGDLNIPEGWTSYWFSRTWGYKEPKKWAKGTYALEITINDEATLKSSFTIV